MSVEMWNCHCWPLACQYKCEMAILNHYMSVEMWNCHCLGGGGSSPAQLWGRCRFICLLYICIVQDLERKLIWFAWFYGGFICLLYIYIVQDLERNLIWFAQLTGGVHLPAIYMHCSRSWKKSDLVCSVDWGGGSSAFGIYVFSMHWYFLKFSYKLTVSNGLSLATLKSIEFT